MLPPDGQWHFLLFLNPKFGHGAIENYFRSICFLESLPETRHFLKPVNWTLKHCAYILKCYMYEHLRYICFKKYT